MAGRNAPSADPDTALILGEMRAQIRELIHNQNNRSQRDEAVAELLATLKPVPDQLEKIIDRLTKLEIAEHRREGASGLLRTVLRSPVVAWAIAVGGAVWAVVTERLQL